MIALQNKRNYKTAAAAFLAIAAVVAICYGMINDALVLAAGIAIAPIVGVVVVRAFDHKKYGLFILITVTFFIPVASHYIYNAPLGVITDALIVYNIFLIICNLLTRNIKLTNISFDVLLVINLWMLYCFLQLLNPRMITTEAWMSSIRGMALYFFFVVLLTQILIDSFAEMKEVMALISVLVIISALKALYQMYIGFTPGDRYFLNVLDGRRTHIIYYGTRYFSIFTDAANFGGCMGMCMAVYMILGFHTHTRGMKIYWWVVAGLACYGMFVSGTRSALVVPVASIMMYLALIRDWKKMIPLALFMGVAVSLLAFTKIGESNTSIRRARTIFQKDEDLSYIGRKQNQYLLKTYLKDLPFGNSLGMSAGRGKSYGDQSPIAGVPTDSWFVQIWVETGIIGQLIYFFVMFYLFIKGAIIVFLRLKDPDIKGYAAGLLSGVAGLFVMSSNNEVFSQIPNGILVYVFFGLIFLCPEFDKEAEAKKLKDGQES